MNPPFLFQLPQQLAPGNSIRIRAFIPPNGDRATINLQKGSTVNPDYEDDEIPLHVDIRQEGEIVRNDFSRNEGGWGEEEVSQNPIQFGTEFEMEIYVRDSAFSIAINGNHYCDFEFRQALEDIHFIYVFRDAQVVYCMLNGNPLRN
ncbi:32 kDa beta-galactoside-binding lectin lec-3-like [Condylostylus longicornis]|uniref:32 kDa beta-galactoside-binding lectin lec-3-like n=1 Tax=Condylostylus longicornis TaxID=2530218 RepID=UPI00244E0D83|nr:32 kDa beta-galactoside-binding lectin lec-3-like [Condylostylus longicornis]